jgi:arylsulfatase A-like enzyme
VAELVEQLDLGPTIADCFGLWPQRPADRSFAGWSLLPVAVGGRGKSAAFTRTVGERPTYALRDARRMFLYDSARGNVELYDLASDPEERKDLASREPLRAAVYRQRLFDWILGVTAGSSEELETAAPSAEQRENMRALGYVN